MTRQIKLIRPCDENDGVLVLSRADRKKYRERFLNRGRDQAAVFVASSGSGSRMFQILRSPRSREDDERLSEIRRHVSEFAFFEDLCRILARDKAPIKRVSADSDWRRIINSLLSESGLNLGNLPKGLVPFHRSNSEVMTAFEEHMLEASSYARNDDTTVWIHFTAAPIHLEVVQNHLSEAQEKFRRKNISWKIEISSQSERSNVVALDENGYPARDADGNPIVKPAGHGALLPNLNSLSADLIFIRTVDNILPERFRSLIAYHKEVLGGLLLHVRDKAWSSVRALAEGAISDRELSAAQYLAQHVFGVELPASYSHSDRLTKSRMLFRILNRPIRVCAMVRHGGDPGGGPFWVQDQNGQSVLRIVEDREIALDSDHQRRIWQAARFFNPVDMVCCSKDYRREPFNLQAYRDAHAGIRVARPHGSRNLTILEQPGLWNGAMADWNSVFVKVPRVTVHPVKSLHDLLSWQHLPRRSKTNGIRGTDSAHRHGTAKRQSGRSFVVNIPPCAC